MDMDRKQRRQLRFSAIYLVVALLVIWLFQTFIFGPLIINRQEVPYSQFRQDLEAGNVVEVLFSGDRIFYVWRGPSGEEDLFNVVAVEDPDLVQDLLEAGVPFRAEAPGNDLLTNLLGWVIPFLPLMVIWYLLYRQMDRGGAQILSFGKSRARSISGEMTGVTFADVGGVDEVTTELREIIEFLKNPQRFIRLGAKLPKGVLLVGPPGTGKTLLARATAGEAGVPFFYISGSDFVEMFVGVGAARVRDLFEQAKRKAPCIVFIDEIDAIGQTRGVGGRVLTNDEREQTLNQLLSEMDGFEPNQSVVIMAATNRPEILDKALLRPGRFDRQIQVPPPTEEGRRQILRIHTRNVALGPDVDLDRLAQITPGFTGADLSNVVNEAALMAARRNSEVVTMADFDLAIERVIAGLQRKVPLGQELKRRVAYHEGGHALVAELLPHTDPVHKVSIIPTAKGALGYTMQMPEEDQYLISEQEIKERLAVMLAGRAAELLIFNEPSSGAANDLERATAMARQMVTEYGMAEALGPVRYASDAGMGYLGLQVGLRQDISPETARLIDQEIRRLVEEAQQRATALLREHESALHAIARVLQEKEVISGEEIRRIVQEQGAEQAAVAAS